MRITDVRAVVTCPGRNFVLVKVVTDVGLVGWGDATLNGRELTVATHVDEYLRPLLLGEDPGRIEHLWNALYTGAYWRGGPVQNTALAGVDMALWDLLGKRAGLPVYQLLGGRCRDGATAYVHVSGTTPQIVAERVRHRMADGFKACRVQLERAEGAVYGEKPHRSWLPQTPAGDVRDVASISGGQDTTAEGTGAEPTVPLLNQQDPPFVGEWEPTPYLRGVPQLLRHLREALGDEVELLHDVHHRLSPIQAAELATEIAPFHLFYLEDPVAPEYAAVGLPLVRQAAAVPIALGEGLFDVRDCLPLLSNRLIDYLRCDLGHVGGITAARKLAALAEPFAVRTAWHGPPDLSPVGHAANVHVDLAVPNFGIQEWYDHAAAPDLAACREVFKGGVVARDGMLDAPEAPGLGVAIDEAAARRYPYRRAYLPVVRRTDGSVYPW